MLVQFPNTFKVLLLVTDAEVLIVMFLTFALVEITGLVLTRGIIISLVLVGTVQLFQLALTFQSVLVLPVQVGVHALSVTAVGAEVAVQPLFETVTE